MYSLLSNGWLELVLIVCQTAALRVLYLLLTTGHYDYRQRRKMAMRYVSFSHAVITAIGSLVCVVRHPYYPFGFGAEYIDATTITLLRHVLMFSISYFVYDMLDMVLHGEGRKYTEYLIHHTLAILAEALVVIDLNQRGNHFVGLMGILPEVNTIFIHMRLILKIGGVESGSALYKCNQVMNIVTFLPFRFLPFVWLIPLVVFGGGQYGMSWLETAVWLAGATFATIHNYRIFTRLLIAEGFMSGKAGVCQRQPSEETIMKIQN